MKGPARPLLIAGVLGWLLSGVFVAGVAVLALLVAPRLLDHRREVRNRRRLDAELATAMELAARGSRNGLSPLAALHRVTTLTYGLGAELVGDLVQDTASMPLGVAADRWARRHPGTGVAVVAATVGLVADGEAAASRAFEAAASYLRNSNAATAEATTWASQARASAALLVAAPVGMVLLGVLVDPGATSRMVSHPVALGAVLAAVVLEALGAWWMARLVRSTGSWLR